MADSRDTYIGTDSTGTEYWLVPFGSNAGNRMIEVRKSKKSVPKELLGMWTNGKDAIAAFESYINRRATRSPARAE